MARRKVKLSENMKFIENVTHVKKKSFPPISLFSNKEYAGKSPLPPCQSKIESIFYEDQENHTPMEA